MKITISLNVERYRKPEPAEKPIPQRQGNNFASAERKHDTTAHELDVEARPGPYGRFTNDHH